MKRALCLAVGMVGLVGHQGVVTARSEDAPAEDVELDTQRPVLDGCAEVPPRIPDESGDLDAFVSRESACVRAARTVVASGTDTDRARLWSVFDGLPDDSPLAGDVVDAFLDRQVQLSLAALQGKPTSPSIKPPDDADLPSFLRSAPVELQEARRLYQSVVQAEEERSGRPHAETAIAFQSNQPAFWRAVAGFLRGRLSPGDTVADVSRFEWAGRCGTGSEELFGPKAKVLVVAHLELGRIDLALAAARSGGFMGSDQSGLGADPRLLTAAGIDWERFYLGGVLSGRMDLAMALARRGSNGAARSLLTYARLLDVAGAGAPKPELEQVLSPLAALVEPGEREDGVGRGTDSREASRVPDAEPIGADVQQGVLELLAAQVGPNASAREAATASSLLVELSRPESRPAFQAMLQSPYGDVRRWGAAGLRAFGETVADPPPSRPVAFRLDVDGRPLRSKALFVMLEKEGGERESSRAQTDEAGIVELERDSFVDPRRRLVSIRLAVRDGTAEREWLEIKPESLPDLDAVTTVSIRTGTLTVVIPPSLLEGSPPPTLTLLAVRDGDPEKSEGEEVEATPIAVDLPVASTLVVLRRLQHGRYRVWLDRGAAIYESPVIEVGPEPVTATVDVDPIYGTDEEPEERAASPTNQPL